MAGAGEPVTGGVVPPVHVATTFVRDPDNQYRSGFAYGRPDNASVRQAEAVIAALEGGSEALLFASGMAAATAVVLALDPGTHLVAPQEMYWGLRDWLTGTALRYGYRVDLVDMTDLAEVRRTVTSETRLVWIETPSNPRWSITDIAAVADIAHAAGALLAIDSTVSTPVFTQPLAVGADIVMHSAPK
jgi:cystathionine gamma-synthase